MPKRKKILFVVESLSGGGAEKVLSTIVKQIDKKIFFISVCSIVDTGCYVESVKKHADKYTCIIKNCTSRIFPIRCFYKILYKLIYRVLPTSIVYKIFIPQGSEIEVAFTEGFATKLMAFSTNKKAKKIAWIHTDLEQNHWTSSIYKRNEKEAEAYRKFDKVICVSEAAKLAYERLFNFPSNSSVVYNPIDHDEVISKSRKRGILPDKKSDLLRFISCGRLVKQKGFDRLIESIKSIVEKGYRIELFIFGDGEERSHLDEQIKNRHLEKVIELCGFNGNIYSDMKSADLFICSSRAEGFSLVVAESLILGVPVLSTNCSGPDELLKYGEYGILCENSTQGLIQSLEGICKNRDILRYYKKKASMRGGQLKERLSISNVENIFTSW